MKKPRQFALYSRGMGKRGRWERESVFTFKLSNALMLFGKSVGVCNGREFKVLPVKR